MKRPHTIRRAELADLAAFVAVAENRNFRGAASRLGVTPSALSHTIRQLEERLDIRLLNLALRAVGVCRDLGPPRGVAHGRMGTSISRRIHFVQTAGQGVHQDL